MSYRRHKMMNGIPGRQIEFIQGNGTQYIITDLTINENTDAVEIDFALNPYIQHNCRIISGNSVDTQTLCLNSSGTFEYRYFYQHASWPSCNFEASIDRVVIKVDYKNRKIFKNNIATEDAMTLNGVDYRSLPPLRIGYGSDGNSLHMNFKLFAFKFWRNDKLIFDGVPIEIGGVGYLYDKVRRKKYGNDGSGMFILSSNLPYDSEIEYLESSGPGCYIDTGIIVDSSTYNLFRFGVSKTHAEAGGDIRFIQSFTSSPYGVAQSFITDEEKVRTRWGKSNATELPVSKGDIVDIYNTGGYEVTKNVKTGYGLNATIGNQFSQTDTMKLLSLGYARLYCARIGNLDLTPVRIGQVGYMYDRNSGQLFAQQGNGEPFILGRDQNLQII